MIAYNPKDWFGLIFRFHKSDTFRTLFWVMLSVGLYSALLVWLEIDILSMQDSATTTVHSLLGFVISLLLVFRTNTAYDRWWEGRKQWGALVNVSRNFAFKINAFVPQKNRELRQRLTQITAEYAGVLRHHLRPSTAADLKADFPDWIKVGEDGHYPNAMANQMQHDLLNLHQNHQLSEAAYLAMLQDLNAFTDICGACERIKKTPIPYTYNIFIKKFIFAYIITMPIAFVGALQYWTILVTVFTFYVFASLELIAEEIEDPFGKDENDLPTDTLSETINANVNAIIDNN